MSTITGDWCVSNAKGADESAVFTMDTTPDQQQKQVLKLLHQIKPWTEQVTPFSTYFPIIIKQTRP